MSYIGEYKPRSAFEEYEEMDQTLRDFRITRHFPLLQKMRTLHGPCFPSKSSKHNPALNKQNMKRKQLAAKSTKRKGSFTGTHLNLGPQSELSFISPTEVKVNEKRRPSLDGGDAELDAVYQFINDTLQQPQQQEQQTNNTNSKLQKKDSNNNKKVVVQGKTLNIRDPITIAKEREIFSKAHFEMDHIVRSKGISLVNSNWWNYGPLMNMHANLLHDQSENLKTYHKIMSRNVEPPVEKPKKKKPLFTMIEKLTHAAKFYQPFSRLNKIGFASIYEGRKLLSHLQLKNQIADSLECRLSDDEVSELWDILQIDSQVDGSSFMSHFIMMGREARQKDKNIWLAKKFREEEKVLREKKEEEQAFKARNELLNKTPWTKEDQESGLNKLKELAIYYDRQNFMNKVLINNLQAVLSVPDFKLQVKLSLDIDLNLPEAYGVASYIDENKDGIIEGSEFIKNFMRIGYLARIERQEEENRKRIQKFETHIVDKLPSISPKYTGR